MGGPPPPTAKFTPPPKTKDRGALLKGIHKGFSILINKLISITN